MMDVQKRWPVSKPLVDGLGGGLYEVRTSVGKLEYRVLFCIDDECFVALHGFNKKTKSTPQGDMNLARDRKRALT